MISLYALAFRVPKYFKESINSIIRNASEPLDITVVDNKSKCSDEIAKYGKHLVDEGKISRIISMANNPMINSFNHMYEHYPPDATESFFVMTELDLVVPDGCDWIKETREMQSKAVLGAFPLSLENYKPPNRGHIDDPPWCGLWLCSVNKEIFKKHYNNIFRGRNKPLSDHAIREMMAGSGKVVRSDTRLYHLAWDLPFDPELQDYWREKEKGIRWHAAPRGVVAEIYERKS